MPTMPRVRRLDEIKARLLSGSKLTIRAIMEEYGVSRRTADRDLVELGDMGVNLEHEELSDGRRAWCVPQRSRTIDVRYTLTDVTAMMLGRRLFDFLKGTLLEESLERVYNRIQSQLDRERDIIGAERLGRKVYLIHEGPKRLPKRSVAALDTCLDGLLREERLSIRYVNHRGDKSRRVIHPYTLIAYKRGLYVLGFCELEDQVRVFSLERIARADWLKGDRFEYPTDFEPGRFFDRALFIAPGEPVPVEIRLTPGTEPFVRIRKFHKTQKLRKLEGGFIQMTLKVPVNFETVNWVLSFGSNAEVVSPPELRDQVRQELELALERYR